VSDEMMFGIAKMPYEMAMGDEMSRRQFYANTQRLAAALEAAREDAYVALVVDIRLACGDNGKRSQPELVEYIRGLARDAARYRWLRDREIPEWLDLWHQNPDRIDAAIDQARGKGVQS